MLSVHSCPVGNLGARDTGGMSVYIREVAAELGKAGHHVDVYTRVHDFADPQIVQLGRNARLIHLRAGKEEEMHKLVLYSHLPDFACNLENYRKEHDLKYDLVFSHYWLSGWVGEYVQHWWHIPHVIMFHTLGAVKNALGIGEDEPELRIATEEILAGNCHRIIASTQREREELFHHYGVSPGKIAVMPCGVNVGMFHPIDRMLARKKLGLDGDKIILFAGRIEPLKGVEQLLRAIPSLKNIPGINAVIIGGDEYSRDDLASLERLSSELGIDGSVTLLGLVKHEQMPDYYSAVDVCVVPSYYESFGLVALESLACGTPVVASDVGDLKSIIRQGKTGYIIPDNDPRHLADKIASLLSASGKGILSSFDISASVNRFKWSNITRDLAREFRRLLAGHMAPVS